MFCHDPALCGSSLLPVIVAKNLPIIGRCGNRKFLRISFRKGEQPSSFLVVFKGYSDRATCRDGVRAGFGSPQAISSKAVGFVILGDGFGPLILLSNPRTARSVVLGVYDHISMG
jgi:hypothetical protein